MNAPVTWLERKGLHRGVATLLVFAAVLVVVALLGWLVVPRVARETAGLVANFPGYANEFRDWVLHLFRGSPEVAEQLPVHKNDVGDLIPPLPVLVEGLGRYSLSLLGAVVLTLLLLSLVFYMVLNPRPLLRLYLRLFPEPARDRAERAFSRASVMVVGWMWSNVLVGAGEAVLVFVVLSYLGVPAALVWAALALFAELVPKVGLYLMAIPPALVALATDPMTALWVVIFYLAMNEVTGNFITPRIRASTMNIHPVSVLFAMLVMGAAFGLLGALIATPLVAFVEAYAEGFYLGHDSKEPALDGRVENMLGRTVPSDPDGAA